jgi:U1 small nuclear ribonucleoprotein C
MCLLQPSVRKQHNAGFKHKANVRAYYLQFEQQETEDMLEKKMAANMAIAMQPSFGQPAVLPGTPALPRAGLVRPHMGGMPGGMPGGAMPPIAGLRPPPSGPLPVGMQPPPAGLHMPGPPSMPFT